MDRLGFIERQFDQAAVFFTFPKSIKTALANHPKITKAIFSSVIPSDQIDLIADDELWPFASGSLSLAICLHNLSYANDLPGALSQIKKSLKPDGLLLSAFLGGNTLYELRDVLLAAEAEISGGAAMRVHPMVDVKDAGGLLQRVGFALPVVDVETQKVTYATLFDLLADLRSMGLTNMLKDQSFSRLTRPVLMKAAQLYQDKYSNEEGRITATFDILWLSGWAPHESQQKPLKPGSATHKMADFLGNEK